MKKSGLVLAAALLAASAASSAQAQDTVKIGLIMAYSGQFADTAAPQPPDEPPAVRAVS